MGHPVKSVLQPEEHRSKGSAAADCRENMLAARSQARKRSLSANRAWLPRSKSWMCTYDRREDEKLALSILSIDDDAAAGQIWQDLEAIVQVGWVLRRICRLKLRLRL